MDVARLLPYLAAIEACKSAASTGIVPPQWQKCAPSEDMEAQLRALAALPDSALRCIDLRKQQLLLTNDSSAHRWVKQRFAPGGAPMSLDDILSLHRMVAQEAGIRYHSAGRMREDGFRVVVGQPHIGYHVGAPSLKLPRLMEQYIQFINSHAMIGMPPAVHALVAHFFFTTIHPFEDGNGRVSRLVTAAILFQRGYSGHGFYAISHHFYANQDRYHRLLVQTQERAWLDLTEFVAFGLEGLTAELQGISSFLRMKLQRNVRRDRWPGWRTDSLGYRCPTKTYSRLMGDTDIARDMDPVCAIEAASG